MRNDETTLLRDWSLDPGAAEASGTGCWLVVRKRLEETRPFHASRFQACLRASVNKMRPRNRTVRITDYVLLLGIKR
jgi:hypothetical protein